MVNRFFDLSYDDSNDCADDRTTPSEAPTLIGSRMLGLFDSWIASWNQRPIGATTYLYTRRAGLLPRQARPPSKRGDVLEEHDGMEILYLPTATLGISAVESVWKDTKYRLVTSEHHETLEDLTRVVSEYFRTCPIRLDIHKSLYCCVWGKIFNERHSSPEQFKFKCWVRQVRSYMVTCYRG